VLPSSTLFIADALPFVQWKHNVNGTKNAAMLFLGYSLIAEHHILVHFWQMLLPSKASKNICAKAALL
jgi:hypothetical protein